MNQLLIIFVVLLILPYLVVPIMIRKNQFFSVVPQIRRVIDGFLPVSVKNYFEKLQGELSPLGFKHRMDAVSSDYGPNLRVYLRVFVGVDKPALAIATSLLTDKEASPLSSFIEFSSRFSNGREVSTHNSDLTAAPIEPRQKTTSALPVVDDAQRLFAYHELLLRRLNLNNAEVFLPEEGRELEMLADDFKSDLKEQCSLGSLTYDDLNGCYRPTWAGACLMGWASMWPFSQIRRHLLRIKAKWRIKFLLR